MKLNYVLSDLLPGFFLRVTGCDRFLFQHFFNGYKLRAMVTMGSDLQPGCLADRLLTGLGQPQINP